MPTPADIVIAWSFASVPKKLRALFSRPTLFIDLPTPPGQGYHDQVEAFGKKQPIRGILEQLRSSGALYVNGQLQPPGSGADVTPLRVFSLGFSESCQGPRALLSSDDGGRIDSVLAVDGIHAQFVGDKRARKVAGAQLAPWGAFARLAATHGRQLIVTTSSIDPKRFADTTSTSNWIWRAVTGGDGDLVDKALPPGVWEHVESPPFVNPAGCHVEKDGSKYCWPETTIEKANTTRYRRVDGLWILNYTNVDPTGIADHIFQAKRVLPLMLEQLITRWNATEPAAGVCLLASPVPHPECNGPNVLPPGYMEGTAEPAPLDLSQDQGEQELPGGPTDPMPKPVNPAAPPPPPAVTIVASPPPSLAGPVLGLLSAAIVATGAIAAAQASRKAA